MPPTPSPTWHDIEPIDIKPFCEGKDLEIVLFLDTSWSFLEDSNSSWFLTKQFSADLIGWAYNIVHNLSLIETGDPNTYSLKVSFITFANDAELIYNLDEFGDDGISTEQQLKDAQEMVMDTNLPDIIFRDQMQGTHARDAIELYLNDIEPVTASI